MIKITSVNRKLLVPALNEEGQTQLKIMDTNCNVTIAVDCNFNKAHFELNGNEAVAFEEFCQQVEARIASEIADADIGLAALFPHEKREDEKARAATT